MSCRPSGKADATTRRRRILPIVAALVCLSAGPSLAHGVIGKRFFPATPTTDDPFVADELSLPTVSTLKRNANGDDPAQRDTAIAVDVSKRITPDLAISLGQAWHHITPDGGSLKTGFGNLDAGIKYQLFKSGAHEAVFSIGVSAELDGTGSTRVGAERFTTVTPGLFFGKGLGDLFDGAELLKPFAVTGVVGYAFPTRITTNKIVTDPDTGNTAIDKDKHANVLQWGGSVQYSLPYLQSFVRDVGLGAPFKGLIPLVEVAFETPTNHGGGKTAGIIAPGLIWSGKYFQLAAEALIPVNAAGGRGVGALFQVHFYLDDLFPNSVGKPIFGQ